MKICTRCGNVLPDEEEFCSRCGGRNFKAQVQQNSQGQQMQRPQGQGQPMQRPQQQQGQQMQRPQGQGQPIQRPQQQVVRPQGQQMPRPQQQMQRPQGQGQPVQRPQQQMQRPQQQVQPVQNQNMAGNFGEQQFNSEMFPDTPVETKKGLFKKSNKQPKQPKQQPQMQQQVNNNGFEPTMEPIIEDGSNVGDWIKTLLIFIIPIYGLIKYFTGMKDMSQPAYKRNFYKAFFDLFCGLYSCIFGFEYGYGSIVGSSFWCFDVKCTTLYRG